MGKGEIIRGNIETIILSILEKNDEYGYQISKIIESISNNKIVLTEATYYNSYKRMLEKGLVTYYWTEVGKMRKYYRITKKGKATLRSKRNEWNELSEYLNILIGGNYER